MEDEAVVALHQELLDKQLVSLGLSPEETATAAASQQADGVPEVSHTSFSVHGAMVGCCCRFWSSICHIPVVFAPRKTLIDC